MPLNLLELLQVLPDFTKYLRYYLTRVNTTPIRRKRSYRDIQPTVKDEDNIVSDTLLAQIGELNLTTKDDFVSDNQRRIA